MEFKKNFIQINTGKINYIENNSNGEIIHFLHANGFSSGVYIPLLKLFKDNVKIIASDVRGFGDSDYHHIKEIKNWNPFVNDLKKFINLKTNSPIIGAGHSFGATTTLLTAIKYPELFKKIILIDPVILSQKILLAVRIINFLKLKNIVPLSKGARRRKDTFSSKKDAMERFSSGRGLFSTWEDNFIESYVDHALKVNDDRTLSLKCSTETEAQIYGSLPTNIWRIMKKVKCPILIIKGENSDTFTEKVAEKMQKKLKNIRIESIQDCGHFVPMENPTIIVKLINKYITT